eukprot:7378096-Prymnesium_polylepis.1
MCPLRVPSTSVLACRVPVHVHPPSLGWVTTYHKIVWRNWRIVDRPRVDVSSREAGSRRGWAKSDN